MKPPPWLSAALLVLGAACVGLALGGRLKTAPAPPEPVAREQPFAPEPRPALPPRTNTGYPLQTIVDDDEYNVTRVPDVKNTCYVARRRGGGIAIACLPGPP